MKQVSVRDAFHGRIFIYKSPQGEYYFSTKRTSDELHSKAPDEETAFDIVTRLNEKRKNKDWRQTLDLRK
jgi:hypothetical protein